jgi:putative Holliday junction resolvase
MTNSGMVHVNYLGIDYGRVHLGVARSAGGIAEPVEVIKLDKSGKYWGKLQSLAEDYEADEVVVGLPEGVLVKEVRRFGQQLEEELKLPVRFEDETLSSRDAVDKAAEAGKTWRRRKEKEHAMAAAVILQNYLDRMIIDE